MAISKLILDNTTQMDVTQDTVTAGSMLSGVTAHKNDGTQVTGNIATKTASNLSASGKTVTVPAGYYAQQYTKDVSTGSATTPATTITANPSISVSNSGLITATASATQSVTPTVSAGYVSSGTAGTITVSGSNTSQLTTQAAQTITPGTTNKTIASGKYLTGTQTIKGDANLVAGNIKKDVSIFGVTGSYEGSGGSGKFAIFSGYSVTVNGSLTKQSGDDFTNTEFCAGINQFAPVVIVTLQSRSDYLYYHGTMDMYGNSGFCTGLLTPNLNKNKSVYLAMDVTYSSGNINNFTIAEIKDEQGNTISANVYIVIQTYPSSAPENSGYHLDYGGLQGYIIWDAVVDMSAPTDIYTLTLEEFINTSYFKKSFALGDSYAFDANNELYNATSNRYVLDYSFNRVTKTMLVVDRYYLE